MTTTDFSSWKEIECTCWFYEIGKSKSEYTVKKTVHVKIPEAEELTFTKLKKIIREQAGINETCRSLGWNQCEISLSRGKKSSSGTTHYAIKTDFQVNIEMPHIRLTDDKLHATNYPVETRFKAKAPIISVEITNPNKITEKSKVIDLTCEDNRELKDKEWLVSELAKLSNSTVAPSSKGRIISLKKKKRKKLMFGHGIFLVGCVM